MLYYCSSDNPWLSQEYRFKHELKISITEQES